MGIESISDFARAFIGLGSNEADPVGQLQQAILGLGELPESRVVARSSLYRSAPVGFLDQPDFVNAVVELETRLPPKTLLDALLDCEHRQGRVRRFQNAPRTLDLDLLMYGDVVCDIPGLTLPHPRMTERAFVLVPLVEICPECVIPGHGPATGALAACGGQDIKRIASLRETGEIMNEGVGS